jgi:hypothetical protein
MTAVTSPSIFLKSRSIPTQKSPPRFELLAGILSKFALESLEVRPPIEMMAMVTMMPGEGHCCHSFVLPQEKCPEMGLALTANSLFRSYRGWSATFRGQRPSTY